MPFFSKKSSKVSETSAAEAASGEVGKEADIAVDQSNRPTLRKAQSECVDKVGQSNAEDISIVSTAPPTAGPLGQLHQRSQSALPLEHILNERPSVQLISASVCPNSQSFMNVVAMDASISTIRTNNEDNPDILSPVDQSIEKLDAKLAGVVQVMYAENSTALVPERFFKEGNPIGESIVALSTSQHPPVLSAGSNDILTVGKDLTKLKEVIDALVAFEEGRNLDFGAVNTSSFGALHADACALNAHELVARLEEAKAQHAHAESVRLEREIAAAEASGKVLPRDLEAFKVRLQQSRFEVDKAQLEARHRLENVSFAFNMIVVGVTGSGKSSSLNTVLDHDACLVSGGQGQGTRGTQMQDGAIGNDQFVTLIDTQGLGADTFVTDEELLAQIMLATESVLRMKVINNVLISCDLQIRSTPSIMANQLTLMELFTQLKSSCFLCFTKWNTPAIQSEWNTPLKKWVRKHRRAKSIEAITEDPPEYAEMYMAYTDYILRALHNDEDGGSFSKMGTFLAFFEARVVWSFNLDALELEDRADGELAPHVERLYTFYRQRMLATLRLGGTRVDTQELTFLKGDEDTLRGVARAMIDARDDKIRMLERCGLQTEKREQLKCVFVNMSADVAMKIKMHNYITSHGFIDQLADIAGYIKSTAMSGCQIQ